MRATEPPADAPLKPGFAAGRRHETENRQRATAGRGPATLDSNLLLRNCVLVTGWLISSVIAVNMNSELSVSVIANFLLMAGLVFYGFTLFAEYQARGRWAKNVTGLLAGLGMLALAFALLLTPRNAEVLVRIAQTAASTVFVWISTGLLLAAIAAFGAITYSKPLRLWHERKIERDLNRELPKIP